MRRHSSTVTEVRVSKAMSSAWPAIISWVAVAKIAVARTRSGVGSSSSTWVASVARASPAMMAEPIPNWAQTVGR